MAYHCARVSFPFSDSRFRMSGMDFPLPICFILLSYMHRTLSSNLYWICCLKPFGGTSNCLKPRPAQIGPLMNSWKEQEIMLVSVSILRLDASGPCSAVGTKVMRKVLGYGIGFVFAAFWKNVTRHSSEGSSRLWKGKVESYHFIFRAEA